MINWKKANKYLPWWDKKILSENPLIADIIKILIIAIGIFGIILWLTASNLTKVKSFELENLGGIYYE